MPEEALWAGVLWLPRCVGKQRQALCGAVGTPRRAQFEARFRIKPGLGQGRHFVDEAIERRTPTLRVVAQAAVFFIRTANRQGAHR